MRRALILLLLLVASCGAATARAGGPLDGSWQAIAQAPGGGFPSGAYDPVRHRFLILDGGAMTMWSAPLAPGAPWIQLSLIGAAPTIANLPFRLLYDATRDRLIAFATRGGAVYALSLAGTPSWSMLTAGGFGPHRSAAVYDAARDRIVAFGGETTTSSTDDVSVFSLATNTWTTLAIAGAGPARRGSAASVYDPVRDRMLIFGGYDQTDAPQPGAEDAQIIGAFYDDVWAFDLATDTWSEVMPASADPPSARAGAAAVYDPVADRLIVAGGGSPALAADAWALNLTGTPQWTPYDMGAASARSGVATAYDPVAGRLLMFGGDLVAVTLASGAVTTLSPATVSAPPRRSSALAIDALGGRLVVFGGWTGAGSSNEVWTLPLSGTSVWSQWTTIYTRPQGFDGASGVADPARNQLVMWGGKTGVYNTELWTLRLDGPMGWANLGGAGSPPGRQFHSAVVDAANDRMIVFGGRDAAGYRNDVWERTLGPSGAWTMLIPHSEVSGPSPRDAHAVVYDPIGQRMIMFGGRDAGGAVNDVWSLALDGDPVWEELHPQGVAPLPRYFHSAVFDAERNRMVVLGGYDAGDGAAWGLDLTGTPTWDALVPDGGTAGWIEHAALYDAASDRMLVFGGLSAIAPLMALAWETVLIIPPPGPQLSVGPLALGAPYPNPTGGALRAAFRLVKRAPAEITLLDLQGRVRARATLDGAAPQGEWRIDTGERLDPGVYFLRLRQDADVTQRRFVVAR